jgi:hypothetical protein
MLGKATCLVALALGIIPAAAQASTVTSVATQSVRQVTREFLLGPWTDGTNCADSILFLADGRFILPAGGGRWTLAGDRLAFIGNSTVIVRIVIESDNVISLHHVNGTVGRSVRCVAASG